MPNQRCSCPACHVRFLVPDDLDGKTARCPKCRAVLTVKAVGGKTTLLLAGASADAPTALYTPGETTSPLSSPPDVLPADQPAAGSARVAIGVCTIVFGSFGVHYFYFGAWVRGAILLLISVASLLSCAPIFILIPFGFGVYDGVRYLSMTDREFDRIRAKRRGGAVPQNRVVFGVLAAVVVLAVVGLATLAAYSLWISAEVSKVKH